MRKLPHLRTGRTQGLSKVAREENERLDAILRWFEVAPCLPAKVLGTENTH
jgi:hypothetical protein